MIFNMMGRLHMGCGESLKGSYVIRIRHRAGDDRMTPVVQKRLSPRVNQRKKRP